MFLRNSAFSGDLDKYYKLSFGDQRPGRMAKLLCWVNELGLHCVAVYRFGQFADRLFHKNVIMGFLPKAFHSCLNFVVRMIYHVDITAVAIGPGFYIGHIGPIYIGATTIGKNFSVAHNVTIGLGHSLGKIGRPTIGDNVWVGTGSTIAGAINVGDNITIMPGSFLSRDFPGGSLIGGNPARVIERNYDNQKLFKRE